MVAIFTDGIWIFTVIIARGLSRQHKFAPD